MANNREIKSAKILLKDIFSNMWFRIPEYQRPYVWLTDQINELLEDLTFAEVQKPEQEYFLGSFVFQSKKAEGPEQSFPENDLLDGQQRMTTLLMLFACIRDLSKDQEVKDSCQKSIFQKGDKFKAIPERTRIGFAIRNEVQDFVEEYIKTDGGTSRKKDIERLAATSRNPSIPNMARAIIEMRSFLENPEWSSTLEKFLIFINNQVLLIYVGTEDLEDAFRLFTILNARGVPLRNSDILKSLNLGALDSSSDKTAFATLWETAEGDLGEDFDRFLNYLRTILVKEKARLNLLQEFEEKIYNPKERDKASGLMKQSLLKKGRETFELVERYLKHYNTLLGQSTYDETGGSFEFDNLIRVMQTGLPSTDWLPPLLRYYDQFHYDSILPFLHRLDNKFSADWIAQYTPTQRIENMNEVLRVIERASSPHDVLTDKCLEFDREGFLKSIDMAVYGRRFTRYLLIRLDFLYHDHAHRMAFESLSAEHILPQNPEDASQWKIDFSDDQRLAWTDRLGNLVLITTSKNASQGRLDYDKKREKYFKNKINTCANSLRVLQNTRWTPLEVETNQKEVLAQLKSSYGIT